MAEIRQDVVKGQWHEEYHSFVFHEVFYVVAVREEVYVHFYRFVDNWEGAAHLATRIAEFPDFSPLGKPYLWTKAVDLKPLTRYKRDVMKLLK